MASSGDSQSETSSNSNPSVSNVSGKSSKGSIKSALSQGSNVSNSSSPSNIPSNSPQSSTKTTASQGSNVSDSIPQSNLPGKSPQVSNVANSNPSSNPTASDKSGVPSRISAADSSSSQGSNVASSNARSSQKASDRVDIPPDLANELSVDSVRNRMLQATSNSEILELLMNPADMLYNIETSPYEDPGATQPQNEQYKFKNTNIPDTLNPTFMKSSQNKSDVAAMTENDNVAPEDVVHLIQDIRMEGGIVTRRNRLLASARRAAAYNLASVFALHDRLVSTLSRCFIFFTRFSTVKGYATRKEFEAYVTILRNLALPKKRDDSYLFLSTFKFLVIMKLQDCFPNHIILKSSL